MIELMNDSRALLGRHIRHLVRMPEKLISMTVMPVAYVAVFGVLFGSAISLPGAEYHDYLMAGIFAQTMLMNVSGTGLGVADDLNNGLVDRFRSLPITSTPVMIARTTSNVLLTVLSSIAMSVVGFAIGWRTEAGPLSVLGGFGLLLLLGIGMAWLGAWLGLVLRSPEVINPVTFMVIMPLTFLSNAFIPLNGLPSWLRTICQWNPLSVVVAACRKLFGNDIATSQAGALVVRNPEPRALLLTVALSAIMAPLAVRAYRKAAAG
ncbi:ABC transporter efflux protein, DrrB family [Actinopolyspora alba]|uniref:Transport permease protein n=1 Tax=Actinopolyspora alba TaxID=673379 RepID=A0A1I1TSX7_9ACTN|nr:ABC transporter permease [Actinopolyspora alba]SFD60328.1 ABC transporter efflux protein, DrrB family [Actinopolyspora alba]